mmetsp:Transcript_17571/g.28089  ORF Transcript_17571/g.28089 Transcript_17571/m.28089 type:complete len:81 (+) Transcript_17571:116-358(+)
MSAVTNNNEDADTKYAALVQAHYDAENDAIVADEVASKRVEVEMNIEDAFEFATRVVDDANIAKQMGREEAHKAKAAVRR